MSSSRILQSTRYSWTVLGIKRSINISAKYYNEQELTTLSTTYEDNVPDFEAQQRQEQLEKKRNKSGLELRHFRRMHKIPTPLSAVERDVMSLKDVRAQFGREGVGCGVDYKYLWPSRQERELQREWEQVAYPLNIHEMIAKSKQDKMDAVQFTVQRQKLIKDNLKNLDKWKQEVLDKVAQKEKVARVAHEKREKLIEEVQLMFGMRIDPNDEKFQEALEKKGLEERKAEKALKKQQKQQKMIEQMRRLADAAKSPVILPPDVAADPRSADGNTDAIEKEDS